ncbi:MAG: hypothetical protein ABWX85_07145, partial [Arthrobacter sp.]
IISRNFMNALVRQRIHGVFLFLTPGRPAGVEARVARPVSRSHGITEKEVGKMITLTSGWMYCITAIPASDAEPRPNFGPTAS